MEAIPPVNVRNKRPMASKKKPKSPDHIIEDVHESLESQPFCVCNVPWVRYDLLKSDEAYLLKVDLPGVYDFIVQTDDINKMLVKGEKKLDSELQEIHPTAEFIQQRNFGPFVIELILPLAVDFSKTEQTFQNGVLTIKCPTKENQWRNINEDIVELTN